MKRFLLISIFVLCRAQLSAEILHVPSEQYSSIQSAINDANDGDTVIVSPGTYQDNINFLGKAITVCSTDPNDPNIVAATIIDGNEPNDPNYASVITFSSGEGNQSILTGLTITGGTGSWAQIYWQYKGYLWNRCGGGVLCLNGSSPTIRKNIFRDNFAGQGGGMYFYDHSNPIVTENTFINNIAIINHGFSDPDPGDPNIYDHGDGGAIVGFQYCDATIVGNVISENYANWYGGGIHLRQWSDGLIENNQIINNGSAIGAGIHVTYSSAPQIIANQIEGNQGSSGAAIYVYYLSEPVIVGNRIRANSALNGIVGVHFSSGGQIKNNLIDENTNGPAIICTGSSPWICHNTIVENAVAAVQCNGSSAPDIENNIIALTHSGYGVNAGASANPTIRYNDVWNNELGNYGSNIADLTGIAGNISADPHFLDEPNLLVHLDYISPCIDAGDPNFVPDPCEADFDGDSRILNARTDIGADEAMPVWNLTNQKEYAGIQAAIDDAGNADTIVVIPGRYLENIVISGKSIQLRSLAPTDWDCVAKTIIDGSITTEPAVSFGGIEDSNCVLTGFVITDANNSGSGGGIAGNGTTASIRFCRITDNGANQGGGIYNCDGLIANCEISNNTSDTSGGGLYGCDGQIYNCFIADNHAETSGGGIYDCNGSIVNNTIAKNSAVITAGGLQSCQGTITNCIVWANTAPNSPGLNDCSEPTFSCLQTASSGEGNIYLDPQFVDPNNADYHLTIYSDCVDVGDNNSVGQQSVFDIDREPRLFIFDPNETPIVDIGADEVVTNQADFDDNGTVDCRDFKVMAEEWLTNGTALCSDFTGDEFINFDDYACFANDWQWEAPWQSSSRESALQFDSSSDGYVWIHTPQGCVLNNVFTFTYTAWIYPVSFSIEGRVICKNERALMTGTNGTLTGYSHGGGTASSVSDVGSLQIGKWQFVMMTYDYIEGEDSLVYLYVDGREVTYQVQSVGEDAKPPEPDWRTEGEWDLVIGSHAWLLGQRIPDAIIDEVAIYDRVLTQEEIDYLYNNGLGRPTPLSLNPIGLWHLDEEESNVAIDSSGNNNDGLLQGSSVPLWTDGKFLEY